MNTVLWFGFGVLTAWLMYGTKEKIPVVKTVCVILFGMISFFIWMLFNLTTEVNNWVLDFFPRKKEDKNDKKRSKRKN